MNIKEVAQALELKMQDPDDGRFDIGEFAEALISAYKAELLNEVGEPVAWRFTAPGITKLDSWPHGGKWHGLYTSDQVAAAILKATKPLEEEIDRLESESEEYAQLQSRCFDGGGSHASVFDEVSELRAHIAELEAENELLKGRKNVELAANTDNAKSKQQRELAGPMEMGQLLAGSTHKTSGDLEIERTKPVTWIHKGGGFISDSRGKFIGCFSGDFRYRDRIICAVNSESETSNQLAAAQEENGRLENQVLARDAELWGRTQEILGLKDQLTKAERRVAEAYAEIAGWQSDGESAVIEIRRKFVKEV